MKTQLLQVLDQAEYVDAHDIAEALDVSFAAAAMALLRVVRQDLAARHRDPDTQLYSYEITPKGEARLDYLIEAEIDGE